VGNYVAVSCKCTYIHTYIHNNNFVERAASTVLSTCRIRCASVLCAKNFQNMMRFDKVIAKIKGCNFLPNSVVGYYFSVFAKRISNLFSFQAKYELPVLH